ncbi:MAG TPA: hypothetical protein VJZ06_02245 [Mobilitalea sp.]|nr:hypothetical protein [Mobilitalea sp.]
MSIVNIENSLPEGLGFRLAMDMKAMTNFVNLPEDKKQELINYIQGSTTGTEAKNRVTEVVSSLHGSNSFQ